MGNNKFYAQLEKFSLFNNHFAFMDTEDYLADGLFIRHQVRVYFGPEMISPDSPYRVILCHVRKRDTEKFLAALEELPNKMLLLGHTDYLDYCISTWRKLEKAKEGSESCGAAGATQQA